MPNGGKVLGDVDHHTVVHSYGEHETECENLEGQTNEIKKDFA